LIPNTTLTPEIVHDSDQLSVDWFVVFDELVALVEVKSTHMSHLARMDADSSKTTSNAASAGADKQLSRADQLLAGDHAAFAKIPAGRPMIAIVVTLEPYWTANSPFIAEFLQHHRSRQASPRSGRWSGSSTSSASLDPIR
jgi:hypothetical protein